MDYQKLFFEAEDIAVLHLIPCRQIILRSVVSITEK